MSRPSSTISTFAAARFNAAFALLGRSLAVRRREEGRRQVPSHEVAPDAAMTGDIISHKNELFDDPTANVVIETCDHVVYRIHDYFLMAGR